MKLWQKNIAVHERIERFTTGKDREMDLLLAPFDVLGSIAHVQMLETIGLLTVEEKDLLILELQNIYQEIEEGVFVILPGVEDVHSMVEYILTERQGDIGKKIHSGRSRNDQVLVDLKMFLRHRIEGITQQVIALFNQLQKLSELHKDTLLPGYTHYQVAMPSSFGLWFGAYAESLADDMEMLLAAYKIVNQNPLGSAAGYGSSFPLNRTMTTQLLGFEHLNYNVVYAQMTRSKSELATISAMSMVAGTLNKLAIDACLYLCQNFSFISFPEEYTTGSSIMPHKKNPDVFELIRARTNRIKGLTAELHVMTANMPSGYHRDWQLLKEMVFPALDDLEDCLVMTQMMFEKVAVRKDIVKDPMYTYMFSVEAVNEKVLQGVPFRDAYKQVGADIETGNFKAKTEIHHTHEGSIGNLCNDLIAKKMEETLKGFPFEKVKKALEELVG